MTTMLHTLPGATDFDLRRQLAELESVASSAAGSTYLAEAYRVADDGGAQETVAQMEA